MSAVAYRARAATNACADRSSSRPSVVVTPACDDACMVVMEDQQLAPWQLANAPLAERLVAGVVKRIDLDAIASCDVTEMWQAFDRIERLGASAKTLLAARVEESGSWRRAGARS